ncbi:MAG: protein kinase [Candidatus Aminicenantes bacterium]|nr:protein kinase [Candidatus Aminicenantes bacterium]
MTTICPKCQHENPEGTVFCGKCGTPLPSQKNTLTKTMETPKEELTTGSTFAKRYQIIEELGKGGMGRVYRAIDKKLNEEVALKLIKPEIASDKKTIQRFSNELRVARKMAHKSIGRMYELMEERGTHFITMEYVPGEDLKSFIRRAAPLSTARTLSIAKQVCEGLSGAHDLGVIHRDLKPQNIMVDKQGNARIMDFGIARSLKGEGITGAGVMIGTPEYMSPEQVEGKDVDQRSDIYSLGVVLYEMVTGQVPFEGDTPFTIGVKHKSEMPKNPQELNTQMPDELSRVILKCLEKDKKNRFQSAAEVRSELEIIEQGIPTTERKIPKKKPLTSREITVTFGLKNLFIPFLAVAAVVIAVLVLLKPWSQKEVVPLPSDKPSLAVVYFENNTGDDELDHWSKALCELLIADLTQSKYIRVLSSDKLMDILIDLNKDEAQSFSSGVLKEIAARGGTSHILRGSYARAGEQFRINAILQETSSMESIGSDQVEGLGEESFLTMVDELTKKVKIHFEISPEKIADDIDEDIEKITTSSPEALKFYIEGRKLHLTGEFSKSIELMEKAVAADPEFAMAYRSMATSYSNVGFRPLRKKYMQKALELSERLSARERYSIQGDFYSHLEKTYDKAIEAYEKLLELYPDDPTGNNNLALIYWDIGNKQKAIEHYENNRKNDRLSIIGYGSLASVYRQVDSYDKAREVLEEEIQKYPDNPVVYQDMALHYRMQGQYDLALVQIKKSLALDPEKGTIAFRMNFRRRGEIYFYMGEYGKAADDFQWLYEQDSPQAQYHGIIGLTCLNIAQGMYKGTRKKIIPYVDLCEKVGVFWPASEVYLKCAYIDLQSGRLQEALKDSERAMDYALRAENPYRQRRALHIKGLTFLRMNRIDDCLKIIDDLKVLIQDSHNPDHLHFIHHLQGKIKLIQTDYNGAIGHFQQALTLWSSDPLNKRADYLESLASAYYGSGNIDKAQEQYEMIISSNAGRFDYGDVYALSYYKLGEIYQQKGWNGKAIEYFEKFLDLWKDADPGLPEVEDARKRVAELKSP